MVLPSSHAHGSGQIHASNDLGQYLASTQPPLASFDSVESQYEELPSANGRDLKWFTDIIDSDALESLADVTSVFETSVSVREDLTSDATGTSLFTLSPKPDSESADARTADNSGFYTWYDSIGLNDLDLAEDLHFNMPSSEWSTTEPAFNLYASSHSGSVSGADSDQCAPDHSMLIRNDAAPKLSVPRLRYFKCPTCNRPFSSEYRFSEHLQKSHTTVQSICDYCPQGFKHKKDLKRHQRVHEATKIACSCGKKYARHDGLLRHLAERLIEAGRHKAIQLNSERRE